MGARSDRSETSSVLGAGNEASSARQTPNNGTNANPVTAGIHNSGTPQDFIRYTPTDLVQPEAKMKLTLIPRPRNSVTFRPSRNPKINPQIIPSGNPLTNRHTTWAQRGT